MTQLKGFQRKYLRGLAHSLNPMVLIGQHGVNDAVIKSVNEALDSHELIKIRFNAFKEKDEKKELTSLIEQETKSELVGMIGHMAIFFRMQKSSEKRKISVPSK